MAHDGKLQRLDLQCVITPAPQIQGAAIFNHPSQLRQIPEPICSGLLWARPAHRSCPFRNSPAWNLHPYFAPITAVIMLIANDFYGPCLSHGRATKPRILQRDGPRFKTDLTPAHVRDIQEPIFNPPGQISQAKTAWCAGDRYPARPASPDGPGRSRYEDRRSQTEETPTIRSHEESWMAFEAGDGPRIDRSDIPDRRFRPPNQGLMGPKFTPQRRSQENTGLSLDPTIPATGPDGSIPQFLCTLRAQQKLTAHTSRLRSPFLHPFQAPAGSFHRDPFAPSGLSSGNIGSSKLRIRFGDEDTDHDRPHRQGSWKGRQRDPIALGLTCPRQGIVSGTHSPAQPDESGHAP